jgi:hypothetical protein
MSGGRVMASNLNILRIVTTELEVATAMTSSPPARKRIKRKLRTVHPRAVLKGCW